MSSSIHSDHSDHITPSVWGPSTWRAIHFIALGYPETPTEDHIQSYGNFFVEVLPKMIPCKSCSDNYVRHLQELPISPYLYSGGKHRLFEWTVELHNIVNKELKKADSIWTPERALAALVSGAQSQTSSAQSKASSSFCASNIIIGSVVVLALIAIVVLLMFRARD